MPRKQPWEKALLKAIGAPTTQKNLNFLRTWQRWEGGHTNNDATYNWLNTTKDAPGATRSINSVGVKAFRDFQSGIAALAQTLNNGRYGDILQGLQSGNPYKSDLSAGLSTWVSGDSTDPDGLKYAAKVMGGKTAAKGSVSPPKTTQVLQAPPVPGFDMNPLSIAFADDPEFVSMLAMVNASAPKVRKPKLDPEGSTRPVRAQGEFAGVVKAAQTQLGKPYVFGSGPDTSSFDCSDLIQWAYKQVGIHIPRTTGEMQAALPRKEWKDIKPGDLVMKTTPGGTNDGGHVVMYIGNGKVIAAPYTGTVVQVQPLSKFSQGGYHIRYVPRKR